MTTVDDILQKITYALESTKCWGELVWISEKNDNHVVKVKFNKPISYLEITINTNFSPPKVSTFSSRLYQPDTKISIQVEGIDRTLELIEQGFNKLALGELEKDGREF